MSNWVLLQQTPYVRMVCSVLPADRGIKQVEGGLVKQDTQLCLMILQRYWSNVERCRVFFMATAVYEVIRGLGLEQSTESETDKQTKED